MLLKAVKERWYKAVAIVNLNEKIACGDEVYGLSTRKGRGIHKIPHKMRLPHQRRLRSIMTSLS